jgi:hypothetical protein
MLQFALVWKRLHSQHNLVLCQRQVARKTVHVTGARRSGRGPGAGLCCICFFGFLGSIITCRLYKLALSDKVQVNAIERQSFRFCVKICSRSTLVGGGGDLFTGFEPALGGSDFVITLIIHNFWAFRYVHWSRVCPEGGGGVVNCVTMEFHRNTIYIQHRTNTRHSNITSTLQEIIVPCTPPIRLPIYEVR